MINAEVSRPKTFLELTPEKVDFRLKDNRGRTFLPKQVIARSMVIVSRDALSSTRLPSMSW